MRKILELCKCPRFIVICLSLPSHDDLREAIRKNQVIKLEGLIEEGAPLQDKSQTILHYAVQQNKLQVVECICTKEKDLIDERNDDGDTALMLSLFLNQTKIIRHLIPYSNVNIRDNNGNTAVIIAAANGNLPALELMIENPKTNPMLKNFEGQTALHRAAYHGKLEVLKYLTIHTRLSLVQTDKKGNNCLHLACMGISVLCARYIVLKVKDSHKIIDERNKEWKTPFAILEEMMEKINTGKKSEKVNVSFEDLKKYILYGSLH